MITLCPRDHHEHPRESPATVSLERDACVFHEGDRAIHWYEVVSGIIRTCRFLADGHRQLTGFYYAEDVFGLDGKFYQESAEAVTEVVLRRHETRSSDNEPDGSPAREDVFEKALEIARQNIFLFGHRTAANRVAAFIIAMADRSGDCPGLQLPMSRSDIADHLNLTLHTVSRTISDFARKRLIALNGPQEVCILDTDRLRAVAGDAGADSISAPITQSPPCTPS